MRRRHARTRRLQGRAPATEQTLNELNFYGPHALEKRKEAAGRTRTWQDSAREHGPVARSDRLSDWFCVLVGLEGWGELGNLKP
jgi:hypothetical protein